MIIDLHEDIAYYFMTSSPASNASDFGLDLKTRHVDIPKYKRADVRIVLGSIFPMLSNLSSSKIQRSRKEYKEWSPSSIPISARDVAVEQVKIYSYLEKNYPKQIKIIRKKEDIEPEDGRTGIIMRLEGCEALYEPEDLELFYSLGVRSVGLTWNFDNMYGSSCMSEIDYGCHSSSRIVNCM